ncbi:Shedu anti-phage system protein SduA domain-containing protein [Nonomuraea sp. NPDC046570]|uniref:Shedu anti-phage system protein SduA domain-containing protein n=1 Tax=Nonomuraea sp. NPDC046570 TaxID=3155255 RepID=UPI0034031591
MAGRNRIRSDSVMTSFLRLIHSLAESEQVKSAVQDVLDHIGYPYRGGKTMLDLIRFAIRQAEIGGDPGSASRLDDALGYATGRVLSPDLEDRYQLLDGESSRTLGALELAMSNTHLAISVLFEAFLEEHPEAGVVEAREYFRRLAKASIQVVEDREAGTYRVHRLEVDGQIWLAEALLRRTMYEPLTRPAPSVSELPPGSLAILSRADAESVLAGMQLCLRRRKLAEIRRVVEHPYSSERQIQGALTGAWWLFGGEYVGQSLRRRLTRGLELDIPLLRPDGVLHVVELKRAAVKAIEGHRTSTIPSADVHKGVAQAQNYLKLLDENRDMVLEHGVDTRRATAVLVIGHPDLQTRFSEAQINETLRVYNSHLSRIEVITYKQLLDAAERALDLTAL